MKLTAKYLAVVAMLLAVALGAEAFAQTQPSGPNRQSITSHKAHGKKASLPPPPAVPAVTPSEVQAPPLRPSQMPAVPPRVSYSNGQLTVVAENSTLGDILNAIHNVAGTQIETTGPNAGDRVAAKIGPGSVREVLLAVLQGSRYDYILLGSASNPDQIERVILTPKMGATTTAAQGGSSVAGAPPRQVNAGEDDSDEDSEGSPAPRPGQQVPGQPAPNVQAPTSPVQNVKTPEQLLEDLRRMEQQRRMQNPELPDTRPRIERPPE